MHEVDLLPHKRLIDTLLLGYKDMSRTNAWLKEQAFPTLSSEHYRVVYPRLQRAFPEHFDNEETINPEILDQVGVRDMFAYIFDNRFFRNDSYPKESFDKAIKAWAQPQVRRAIQAMAFAQISEEEIELYANAKYGEGYETEVYMIFFKYFFDPFEWTYMQRREYMEKETDRDLKRLYTLALTKDSDFIVWKLGLAPTRSFADMLEDVVRDCYYNFKEARDLSPDSARNWGNLLLKAMDKIKEVEPGENAGKFSDDFKINLKTIGTVGVIKTSAEVDLIIPEIKDRGPSLEDIQKAVDANNSK